MDLSADPRATPVKREGERVPASTKSSRTAEGPLTTELLKTQPGLQTQPVLTAPAPDVTMRPAPAPPSL
eukprot:3633491-Heterocapsa_arctica.AAC.1